jgi:hypothetical protein
MTIPQPIAFFPAAADHAAGKDTLYALSSPRLGLSTLPFGLETEW